jgi:Mrp family chromosome partitioning ATPase
LLDKIGHRKERSELLNRVSETIMPGKDDANSAISEIKSDRFAISPQADAYRCDKPHSASDLNCMEDYHWSNVVRTIFPNTGTRMSMGITSLGEEGASSTSIYTLSVRAAAHLDSPFLLIEADWTRPSLAQSLGAPTGPGLGELLTSTAQHMYRCIHRTGNPHLWIMPSGCAPGSLNSHGLEARFRAIYENLPSGLQHVLTGLSPIRKNKTLPFACSLVDRIVLVVAPHSVAGREIRSAARRLSSINAKVVGAIWADDRLPERSNFQ